MHICLGRQGLENDDFSLPRAQQLLLAPCPLNAIIILQYPSMKSVI